MNSNIIDLQERIAAMENSVKQMNADIVSIQGVVTSLKNSNSVEKVVEQTDGYVLLFTDGTSVTIKHGKDGQAAPVIGIAEEEGVYYWTVTLKGETSWLEDEEGEKMPVSTVGTTPLLSIDDKGYWIVSYDNGKTYSNVLNEDGNPVSALGQKGDKGDKGEDGADGTNGSNGTSGDSFFKNVEQTDDEVILTLANGTVISIPKVKEFAISISKTQNISLGSEGVTLTYTITGADNDTFVEAYGVGNVEAIVTATSISAGEIRVTLVEGKELTASSKVFVMLCNKDKTITTVLTFTKSQASSGSSAESYDKKDGSWD
ncbi:MAG: hypothetical protein J6B31_08865 [Bacteroidaceae bacterium]|nr:hypothetical protein [Bacteroidaceae bacterium]